MRNVKITLATALMLTGSISLGAAQQSTNQPMDMTATPLPAQCGQASGSAGQSMPGMAGMDMSGMDMSGMDEAHRAYMAGMMRMHPAMMQGIMAEDPDVAFACGMIAHHQGAIDMAEVELEYGDNDEAKQMAQKIIDAQKEEIAEFTTWLEANAK